MDIAVSSIEVHITSDLFSLFLYSIADRFYDYFALGLVDRLVEIVKAVAAYILAAAELSVASAPRP